MKNQTSFDGMLFGSTGYSIEINATVKPIVSLSQVPYYTRKVLLLHRFQVDVSLVSQMKFREKIEDIVPPDSSCLLPYFCLLLLSFSFSFISASVAFWVKT